ncbi:MULTISPECIES: arginine deiminase [unclassified Adlercreutzia]|uniref:arginine deiminase n=1 Tax=unclassified Adlercreutzia TaxID=2636013 RepID=UPI0013EC9F75|nr:MULTISPECIES: arginine deiminase [unclassified Adlercreutzia]
MAGVNVRSEIMPLKKVLLHRPGKELLNLTPNTLEELLFDDIPFLQVAQAEHDAFAQALRDEGVEVVYLEDLMAEVLDLYPELREKFLKQFIEEAGIRTSRYQKIIFDYLNDNYPANKDLVLKTMEGINLTELHTDKSNSLVDLVSEASKMVVAPMPNLYFTRDPFAMIGNGVSINRMYSVTRNRETIYGEYVFKYHPELQCVPEYYSRYNTFHIEGGDILNINEHVLAIGISQRTEPDAIDGIAKNIFESDSPIDTILAFNIPNSRAFMHLDTVFTQIDYDKFTVHPGILGPLTVFEIKSDGQGGIKVKEMNGTLESILEEYMGRPVELIPCGGGDRIAAEREQWNDGSNTLCVRPGTVVVYDRNDVTNALLEEKGIRTIQVPSAELSRGRGGPRCMSMPLWREDE